MFSSVMESGSDSMVGSFVSIFIELAPSSFARILFLLGYVEVVHLLWVAVCYLGVEFGVEACF